MLLLNFYSLGFSFFSLSPKSPQEACSTFSSAAIGESEFCPHALTLGWWSLSRTTRVYADDVFPHEGTAGIRLSQLLLETSEKANKREV